MEFDPSKATGYDGFNIKFMKEMWGTFGDNIIQFVHNFFSSNEFPSSTNTTWVTLVPKKRQPTQIKDYMPISVVGFIYKIIYTDLTHSR